MDDAGWEEELWTDATRDAYLAQAEQAIAELRRHVALVAAATSENDEPRIDQSAESVRLAFIALSDAEFEYSSTLAPFSALETDDDQDADLEDIEFDDTAEHHQLSLLMRRDYAVTSQQAVLIAGRATYLRLWPDETPDDAANEVQTLESAIYQLVHDGTIDALNEVEGLQPVAGLTLTVAQDELLDPEDFQSYIDNPDELFRVSGPILFSEGDVW